LKKRKLKQLTKIGGAWLNNLKSKIANFDIKPAKPIVQELFQQANLAYASEDIPQAVKYLREILVVNSQNHSALFALADLYLKRGQFVASYKLAKYAIKYYPDDYRFYEVLGYAASMRANLKSSAIAYKQALALNPDAISTRHFLDAALQNNPDQAPRQYIIEVFDAYAEKFEKSLVQTLKYFAPFALVKFIQKSSPDTSSIQTILDLGCGTGLLGKAVVDVFPAVSLVGIDISENMLAKAQEKNIYAELHNAELLEYLQQSQSSFDLITATDVLIYFGNLSAIFDQIYRCLKPGALFGFSIEIMQRGTFKLTPSGRYQHSLSYIESLRSSSGFSKIYSQAIDLRKEYGNIVAGYLVLLQK
jgi:predicted TPR repeat methyltransferase